MFKNATGLKPYSGAALELHGDIKNILIKHNDFFAPQHKNNYGLSIFAKNNIKIDKSGDKFVYKYKNYVPDGKTGNHARNIQFVQFQYKNNLLTIINFHDLWNGKGKTDTKDRIEQSKNITSFIKDLKGEVIICGDFNLLPETKSLKIIEECGLRNLVIENNIKSTRTSFYKKDDKYADYIFVSKNIKIKKFKVLPDEVSDHSPLYLEIG